MDPERTFYITALLLLMIFNLFTSFNAIDTITGTNFITDSKKAALISSNGNFELGFFSPGNSQGRYLGIWFNKVSKQTVVWVANRETPLKNSTGTFKITKDGNLAVFDGNKSSPIWSTNISMASTNPTAKLLPSGNLVLVVENKSGNTETVLWQSFDHPTDTVLPGMKFGMNQKTGLNLVLTSWKSSDDPASGEFSARLDSQGLPQFFFYKNSSPHWRGGPWNGITLNGLPDIASRLKTYELDYSNQIDIFNYAYVNNHSEIYVTFTARNNTIFSIMMLEPTGTLQRLLWRDKDHTWARFWIAPEDLCDEYARCGAYGICNTNNAVQCECLPGFEPLNSHDWYANCVEKRKVEGCGKGEGEGFVRLASSKVPDARVSRAYGNMSLQECERECLKSCNCTGYASANVSGSGCIAWYGELTDIRQYEDGQDFYLRVDAVELAAYGRENSKGNPAKKSTLVLIIMLMPIVLVVLLLVAGCYYLWRKHDKRIGREKKQRRREMLFLDSATSLSDYKNSPNVTRHEENRNIEVTFFELSTVVAATDNFSSANKLGQGGFGPVYKGQLSDGREIAVKRLSKKSGQGIAELRNEVLLIAKLQHRNLVRLLGCCIEEEEKMLVYEFMPNKSLDYFIFDQSRKLVLDWKRRYEIILGIARGILYLHQDSRLRIIHRDLKASNILLDGEMNPKISDFGTARIFGGDQSEANTVRVVGTYGYMSPEYALDGLFSMKSDVFSFGVLLLEIVSGKKNAGFFHDDLSSNLIRYAWEMWRDDKALEIVDSFMCISCPASEVLRCIQIGLLCVQDSTAERPTMSTVVFMLSNETTLPLPTQPTFSIRTAQNDPESSTTGTKSSMNELTITMIDAR